jgi:hypothetical protein
MQYRGKRREDRREERKMRCGGKEEKNKMGERRDLGNGEEKREETE